jgi:methyl-accepting chemotaxis protein
VTYSVAELVQMARALSEGEFDQKFEQHFQGELGQLASYLEAVRQTLHSLSSAASGSTDLIPKASDGVAEINREAESGFNSVWEVVEQMQSDQTASRALLAASSHGVVETDVAKLEAIVEKNRQNLLALMSYLSFQDVLRQRLEKVQNIIAKIEEKTLELSVKFKVKSNEKVIKGGDGAGLDQTADLDQGLVDKLMESLR